ncbi:heme-degrading domain-containing protein [Rhodococcus sp. IEGM 1370]|uniref:heme-degrading domain-containing protein n=1 Tax=Rhodococcus sp. IEGM 1370 TaxID=3082222 RepID=UPI002955AEAA|nr:heme-degrading domain-containing protein [Rhodococcus sp. IEGM 1370]MDV8078497.1 heme-degrading domain-containing protein [Rhodococcus sp. IEGM 1370]
MNTADAVLPDELQVHFSSFDYDDAWTLGCQLRSAAVERGLPIVIGVVHGQQRAFHTALPGSYPENDHWLNRKIATAQRYGRSSLDVLELFTSTGRDFDTDSRLPHNEFAAAGGVLPIVVRRVGIVGFVGVSGLPHRDDHTFVDEQVELFRRSQISDPR